jgi:hypothetical protein
MLLNFDLTMPSYVYIYVWIYEEIILFKFSVFLLALKQFFFRPAKFYRGDCNCIDHYTLIPDNLTAIRLTQRIWSRWWGRGRIQVGYKEDRANPLLTENWWLVQNVQRIYVTVGAVCITNAKSKTNEDFVAIFTV